MKTKFSLLFYIRKPKNYVSGPIPVWVRITVNVLKLHQAGNASLRNGTAPLVARKTLRKMSEALMLIWTICSKVYKAHRQLTEADALVTAETIRNKFMGKTEKPRLLLEIFTEHNKKMAVLVGREYTKGTLGRYETSLKHTRNFLKWKYNLSKETLARALPHDDGMAEHRSYPVF